MLKFIFGHAGTGKSGMIMEEISRRHREKNKKSILIVPEQFSHDAERRLCRTCGDSACLYAEVLSFSRLSERILTETGHGGRKALGKPGRILVMERALSAVMPKLKVYNLRRRKTEFLTELLAAYDELKNACIDPALLGETAEELGGTLAGKLGDLSLIFSAFEAMIPDGMIDRGQKTELLSQCVRESRIGENESFFIDGFTDFTPRELKIIEELLKKKTDMTVCLTCGELTGEETVFGLPRRTAMELSRLGRKCGHEVSFIMTDAGAGKKAPAMRLLERRLAEENVSADEKEYSDVPCVYRASTVSGECELAAFLAREFVREKGCRWRDIAVTSGDWGTYEAAVENIFRRYDIPILISRKEDILQKPIMALISGALDIVLNNWDYGSVFRYLKTDLTGLSFDDRDILENYVLKWNIRGRKMWLRDEDWTADPEGYTKEMTEESRDLLERINGIRRQVTEPFYAFEKKLRTGVTVREKTEAVYDLLEEIGLPAILSEKAERFSKEGRVQLRDEYVQLWDIISDAMEQYVGILGDAELDTEEYIKLFRLLISQYEVGTIPSALDRVGTGSMERMRKSGIKHMIILGASDEQLPPVNTSGGLLSDEERDELFALGLRIGDTRDSRYARETGLIYLSAAMPEETLTVIYSGADRRPSMLAGTITELFSAEERKAPDDVRTAAYRPCLELALTKGGDDPCAACAGKYFNENEETKKTLRELKMSAVTADRRLSESCARRFYGNKINLTASRAEKYNACQFSYFMQYGLKAKSRRRAGFDAPETGTFMHYILENSVKEAELAGGFGRIDRQTCDDIVGRWVQRYISDYLQSFKDKSPRFRYLFSRLVRDVYSIVRDMAEELKNSSFKPIAFEMDFSYRGDMPPAELEDGDTKISVSGKVDRADGWVHDGKLYLKVVDYKTGRKEFSMSDVWYGMGIQMLIYLFVLQRHGGDKYKMPVVPAGVLYAPARDVILSADRNTGEAELEKKRAAQLKRRGLILDDADVIDAMEEGKTPKYIPVKFSKDGAPTGSLVSAEDMGRISRHIDSLLLEMGREIEKGSIDANPYYKATGDNACMYCEFSAACQFDKDGEHDRVRRITKLKTSEVFEKLRKEDGGDER